MAVLYGDHCGVLNWLPSQRLQLVAGFTPLNAALIICPFLLALYWLSIGRIYFLVRLGEVRLIIADLCLL